MNNEGQTTVLGVQKASQSMIWWISLATVIAQAVLGILLTAGVISTEMVGSIIAAFAIIQQWANGNNPNIAGAYNINNALKLPDEGSDG